MTFCENQALGTVDSAGTYYMSDTRIKLVKVAGPEMLPPFPSDYG